ncbi:hypothetical protein [Dactylosporangium sp. NPDC000521]|uniref:hypothetical protein n=1 Tax=Dactylosporangium sp. NPDC000521 TaxID=3363975 RepID=UPI0036CB7D3D
MREQVSEPWGLVAAGVLNGAVAPAGVLARIPVGLAVAGVVNGIKVGLGALLDRTPSRRPAHLPAPARGGDAERWLRRAESAVQMPHRQSETPSDAVLRAQAAEALGDLARFAGQVTLIERTSAGIDVARPQNDRARLAQGIDGLPAGPLRAERERALRAVPDQLGVARRMDGVREMLLARTQSAVLGLEGLLARMAELLALHATPAWAGAVVRIPEITLSRTCFTPLCPHYPTV